MVETNVMCGQFDCLGMGRKHGEDGSFVETVSLEDVLEVLDNVRGPVILSNDVTNQLDCSQETARRKLEQLQEQEDLECRKVARRQIYWRPQAEELEESFTNPDAPLDSGHEQ